ncbi:glycine/betaine/sarcosine/D-proline family reductase selenoprotein B [Bombilactobacillus folatiphilus]|uniref:Glycine/betaine/sarcosine/D-proline family reductase selenoprotein B n=1 Tax=Bombilactobacillus folatiphilus TaxID=2923362 RepID=A0ABY4P9J1_9LACO|nr:GrdB-related putative oxidoreductase [Bombilactobacillus folatiphilus]UQS82290.1 glycine/betaine/sarcosine/D-proline family reductase selenoprotein B [Bombilactobacillus folatiphilus]
MIKAIIILDQIQAGLGGKEQADTPYGGKRLAMGAGEAVDQELKRTDGQLLGTFYCGTAYYQKHQAEVQKKFTKMAEKMTANLVILGPAYDYSDFSQMACELSMAFQQKTQIPTIVALAAENNAQLIAQYRQDLCLVKMPKKGGGGLNQTIKNLVAGGNKLVKQEEMTTFKADYCY